MILLYLRVIEDMIAKLSVAPEGKEPLAFKTVFAQSYLTQFRLILWKFWMSYWRNPTYNGTRFVFAVGLALLIGTILWKVGHKKYDPSIPPLYSVRVFASEQTSTELLN